MFRKKALEHISSPKALDDMIQVTSPRAWILLSVFILLVLALCFWSIFGTVLTRVQANGILYAENQKVSNIVAPGQGGYISKINIQRNTEIQKGMLLITLTNPTIENDIQASKAYIKELENKYEVLSKEANQAITEREQKTAAEIQQIEQQLVIAEDKRKHLYDLLQKKIVANKKGLLSTLSVSETQVEYFSQLEFIADTQQEIIHLNVESHDYRNDWNEQLKDWTLDKSHPRPILPDLEFINFLKKIRA